jgi:undecaprenyl-diphosphatase
MAALGQWELGILDWIGRNLQNSFFDGIMPWVSFLGNVGWFWILLALLLLLNKPTRKAGLTMALALVFSLLLANIVLKPLTARIRPFDVNTAVRLLIDAPHDFSFPSGHTQASFAAAAALFHYYKKAGIGALILAALIAFSRLYLYVHYPSDVLAALLFGILLGNLAYQAVKRSALLNSL